MKAYIQTDKDGEFYNVNAFIAYEGFKNFGYEIESFLMQIKFQNIIQNT
ncbi:hypothetical protein GCM10023210_18650 [Chryseobacterium ginsengisoli]|uniref:Uncharacterized protein n=1 Tax=Chryseobacterium ginsengisoli TaxID=363853 RepID=A0ABP9M855_9FLAO